jgi:hypothetical protein
MLLSKSLDTKRVTCFIDKERKYLMAKQPTYGSSLHYAGDMGDQ